MFDWDSSLSLLAKEVLVATVPCAKSFLREKRNVSNETEGEGRRERERKRKKGILFQQIRLTYNCPTLE